MDPLVSPSGNGDAWAADAGRAPGGAALWHGRHPMDPQPLPPAVLAADATDADGAAASAPKGTSPWLAAGRSALQTLRQAAEGGLLAAARLTDGGWRVLRGAVERPRPAVLPLSARLVSPAASSARLLAVYILSALLVPAALTGPLGAVGTALATAFAAAVAVALAVRNRYVHWRELVLPAPQPALLAPFVVAAALVGGMAARHTHAAHALALLPLYAVLLPAAQAALCFGLLQARAAELLPPLHASALALGACLLAGGTAGPPASSGIVTLVAAGVLATGARSVGGPGAAAAVLAVSQAMAWWPLAAHP